MYGWATRPSPTTCTRRTVPFTSWQTSASLGSKSGDWSWWLALQRSRSEGQPQTFATALQSAGQSGGSGVPVTGALPGRNITGQPWWLLGSATQYDTRQDQAKLKLAYDITPTLRASYTLGWWQNQSEGRPDSWLRDAAGQAVYTGPVQIAGRTLTLAPTAFPLTDDAQTHWMHGFSLKSRTQGTWDWELAASLYDYTKDRQRVPTTALPQAANGGPGTLQDQDGTGWNTLAGQGHLAPAGRGRRAHRGLRHRPRRLRTRHPQGQPWQAIGAAGDGGRIGQRRGRPHHDLVCLGAGCLGLRARLESGAGCALGSIGRPRTASAPRPPAGSTTPRAAATTSRPKPRWPGSGRHRRC